MCSHLKIVSPASPALDKSENRTGPNADGRLISPCLASCYGHFFRVNAEKRCDVTKREEHH